MGTNAWFARIGRAAAFGSLLVLLALTVACQTPPTKEREAAEAAARSVAFAKDCGSAKYLAAQKLLVDAREMVNQKKYEEARIAFVSAEKLFKEAEDEASKDPACNKALAPAEETDPNATGAQGVSETDIHGTNVATTFANPLDDPDYELQRVQFNYDSAELDDNAREALTANAAWMKRHQTIAITVEGHCDNRGSVEYNLALGARRAEAVKQYLIQLGVSGARLDTISYGEERPLVDEETDSAFAVNRRAEFRKSGR